MYPDSTIPDKNALTDRNTISKRLIGIGDLLQPGKYRVHSRFSRAINYLGGGMLISAVTGDVGNGPINIVMESLDFGDVSTLEISGKWVKVGDEVFVLDGQKKYRSELPALHFDLPGFRKNVDYFVEFLLLNAPQESLCFMLGRKGGDTFPSAFSRALISRVTAGCEEIAKKNYRGGVALIRGAGYGFTPAGDDFIGGMLGGLYLLERLISIDLTEIRKIIYTEGRCGNAITDTFNYCAWKGRFFEKPKNLIVSLVEGGEEEVCAWGRELLSIGATSGADFAAGLLCALNQFICRRGWGYALGFDPFCR